MSISIGHMAAPVAVGSWTRWRIPMLVVAVAVAGTAGFVLTARGSGTAGFEVSLVRLLRLMAALKLAMAAAGAALAIWRLHGPASARLAVGYGLACVLMASAPGPIWNLHRIVVAGVLFHAGLLLFLLLAATDRGNPVAARSARLGGSAPVR